MCRQCLATKANGEACKGPAMSREGYCWAHNPKNAERRRRQASRAGRAKPNKELQSVKARLSDLAEDVLEGRVETSVGTGTSQILNVYLRPSRSGSRSKRSRSWRSGLTNSKCSSPEETRHEPKGAGQAPESEG